MIENLFPVENLYSNKTTQNKEFKTNSFIVPEKSHLMGNFVDKEAIKKMINRKPGGYK